MARSGYSNGRLAPISLVLSASLFGSLDLMLGIDETWSRWAAVASVRVVAVPTTLPEAGMMFSAVYAKLTGQLMRWN